MDSKLRKMAILASMAVILLVALLVMYVNREQFTAASGPPASGTQNAGAGDSASTAENGDQAEETVSPDGQIGNDLKAFLKDNTFFDQEVNPILEAAKDNSNRLSLVATSIEKDLRIQIVDNEGSPVTGESFYVRLDGLGDYKDLDQDGIIYIGDLDSGDYYIELLPIEGYKVPVSETRVHVKDKVEYLAIDDISLLIKTEDEVDAEAEDSAVADALADADKTEIQKLVLKLADEGKSLIFISSEIEEMLRTCNRMAVLRDGQKVGEIDEADMNQMNVMKAIAGGEQ